MISRLLLAISCIASTCCCQSRSNAPATDKAVIQDSRGQSSNDIFSESQLKEIKRIHGVFSEVTSISLQEMIDQFKGYPNPAEGIATWSKMADVYDRFSANKHIEEYDKKIEAYELIVLRASMSEAAVRAERDFKNLSDEEVNELFKSLQTMGK